MAQLLAIYLASLILRSIGIAFVAGICSWKIRNVAVRHAIWVAVLVAVLLMPVVDFLLPASWVPARIQQIVAKQPATIRIISVRDAKHAGPIEPFAPAVSPTLMARADVVDWWNVA